MPRVGRYLIYGLLDPRDSSLRYIGKTHKRREWRLAEHIELAKKNDQHPVYNWIRKLLSEDLNPIILVWKRIPAEGNWRKSEKDAIAFWSHPIQIEFPYTHLPQTPKSETLIINRVELKNATEGG